MNELAILKISEKITQALRIRAYMIEQNNKALNILRDKELRSQVKGMVFLENNLVKERKILEILKNGTGEGIIILNEFLSQYESKNLSKKTIKLIKSMIKVLDYFSNKSLRFIEERILYEERFLKEKII